MVINVQNLDKIMNMFEDAGKVDMLPFIKRATQLVYQTAFDLAPVSVGQGIQADPKVKARGGKKGDTGGYLRAGIKFKTYGKGATAWGKVSNAVDYAPYLEFGTSKMRAQPFMYPALSRHSETIKTEAKVYVKNYLRNI
jgi:HK97 gp10 family phage protein